LDGSIGRNASLARVSVLWRTICGEVSDIRVHPCPLAGDDRSDMSEKDGSSQQ
jgi:hypothetical protein